MGWLTAKSFDAKLLNSKFHASEPCASSASFPVFPPPRMALKSAFLEDLALFAYCWERIAF